MHSFIRPTLLAAILLASPSAQARPLGPESCANDQALGTSRIVDIDSHAGSQFGNQYEAAGPAFLKDREVVLTFDDGPLGGTTERILTALAKDCVKATFFSVGRMALAYPETLERIARAGHTIGGHTWRHANLGVVGDSDVPGEIEKGFSALTALLRQPVAPFFRFPYLIDPPAGRGHAARRGMAVFGITVNSLDTALVTRDTIIRHTLSGLRYHGKGIVLLHDIKTQTADVLPSLLRAIKDAGFKIVHVKSSQPLSTDPDADLQIAGVLSGRVRVASATASGSKGSTRSRIAREADREPAQIAGKTIALIVPRIDAPKSQSGRTRAGSGRTTAEVRKRVRVAAADRRIAGFTVAGRRFSRATKFVLGLRSSADR